MPRSPFLSETEAAEYLSLAPSTLNRWRVENRGPRHRKFGSAVRYAIADLEDFAASAAVKS